MFIIKNLWELYYVKAANLKTKKLPQQIQKTFYETLIISIVDQWVQDFDPDWIQQRSGSSQSNSFA